MKAIFLTTIVLIALQGFGQTGAEADVQKVSNQIFSWEVENKIDAIQDLFADNLKVVSSRGDIQSKEQYLKTLRSGSFAHDSITVEQSNVTVTGNTAILIGKGWFHMTVSGNKVHRHLSYMEVFTKQKKRWKLLALYANALPE